MWHRQRKRKYKVDSKGNIEPPKGTGGKRAYVMFMLDKADVIEGCSIGAQGLLLQLLYHVEWHTNKLVDKRSKKPLTCKSIAEKNLISVSTIKRCLRELRDKGLINYHDKAYYLDRNIVKKGAVQGED